MEEDFDLWNVQKKRISGISKKILFKEGEVWWCTLGMNLGEEVYGKGQLFRRPVLVLRKLTGASCVVLPITSKVKTGSWYRAVEMNGEERRIMLHQIRMVSTKRFESRLVTLKHSDFQQIKNAVGYFYGIL